MSIYRAYKVIDFDLRGSPIEIDALSDSEAIRKAEQHLDGADLLLWQGTRFVTSLKSKEGRDGAAASDVGNAP